MPHSNCAKCLLKITRSSDNLYCIICNKFFHPVCCEINTTDEFEIMKINFKCAVCISSRRSSITPNNELLVPIPNNLLSINDQSASKTTAAAVLTENNASIKKVANTSDSITAHNSNVIPTNNITIDSESSQDSIADASLDATLLNSSDVLSPVLPHLGIPAISLELIYGELLMSRKSQKSLVDLVNSLKDRAILLEERVIELTEEIESLKSAKAKNVSIKVPSESSTKKKNHKVSKQLSVSSNDTEPEPSPLTNQATPSFASIIKANNSSNQAEPVETPVYNWSTVTNSKPVYSQPKNSLKPIVVGAGKNTDLTVIDKKKWLHLSSFANTVTSENIIDYVVKNFDISKSHLSCFMLVKKGAVISDLNDVNFKLGVSAGLVNKLFDASIWPANIRIRDFDFLEKPIDLSKV